MSEPVLTVRVPAELRNSLKAYAKAAHKSQGAVVVEALQAYLSQRDRRRHRELMNRELRRLDKIERQSPDLREFYGKPDEDHWGAW